MGTVLVVIGLVLLATIMITATVKGLTVIYEADKVAFCGFIVLFLALLLLIIGSLLQEAGL
uniref:Uncharacterized protein n=1 Tax=Mammaliicoccus phage MSShimriz1 TaxID=3230127 RepID=A0AAU8GS93_9VIRU